MSLERRIKKHIHAKIHDFFIVTTPGLETILEEEIKSLGYPSVSKTVGGVETNGKLEDLYKISLQTRTASKILFRLTSFKAENLNKIRKNLPKLNLELFWKNETKFNIKVSSKSSRLYHTDMIKEFLTKELTSQKHFNSKRFIYDKNSLETLFVRLENDKITFSLDSSGEFLYKRNIKKFTNKAPLRENIASALLLKYWDTQKPLMDLMCGSGTFTLEALMIKNKIPAGYFRNFNFMNWENFKDKTFNYLKKEYQNFKLDSKNIYTSDIDEEAIKIAKSNLNIFKELKIEKKDFFKFTPDIKNCFVVINPPYNKRISVSENFYENFEKKLLKDFKGCEYLIFINNKINFRKLKKTSLKIKNGGIPLNIYHGTI